MAITLLDAWVSDASNSESFTVSAGSNRLLIAGIYIEGPAFGSVPTADYGGQAMTVLANAETAGGSKAVIYGLYESGIAAAANTTLTITPTSGTCSLSIGSYENVSQGAVVDTVEAGAQPGETPAEDIDTENNGLLVAQAGAGSSTTHSWTAPLVEQTDQTAAPTTASGSAAHLVPTTGATVSVEHDSGLANPNRTSVAAVSFREASIPVEVSATGDGVGDASAEATRGRDVAATGDGVGASFARKSISSRTVGDGVGDSSATASRDRARAASGDGLGESTANRARQRDRAATADGIGAAEATALRLNIVEATGGGIGGGDAKATVSSITRGSGIGAATAIARRNRSRSAVFAAVGGGSATPTFNEDGDAAAPINTLADTFQDTERPVILIDMEFDSGEVNIWSLPFDALYEGKEYRAFEGLTGGVSFRNSLDKGSPDASADLSGNSLELINIALAEPFQNRVARIKLGNLAEDGKTIEASETLFVGRMVNMPIVIDADGSEVAVEINSIFGDINLTPDMRLSDGDQARVNVSDRMFSRVETAKVTSPRFGA